MEHASVRANPPTSAVRSRDSVQRGAAGRVVNFSFTRSASRELVLLLVRQELPATLDLGP